MTANATKTWLVAYDIRCPRRLRRLHRLLKQEGATVQYSAFSVLADDHGMQRLLTKIEALIDIRVDDVRSYHVPSRCQLWALGVQHLPDGIAVDSADVIAWMPRSRAPVDTDTHQGFDPEDESWQH